MESDDELKEIDSKNPTCYFFDDIIENRNFDFGEILIDKKSFKNALVYDIL